MTTSPGIPPTRIVPSGRTRDGVTMPPPHPLRAARQSTVLCRPGDQVGPGVLIAALTRTIGSRSAWLRTARQEAAAANAVCTGCPVRGECLVLVLRHWDIGQHGVWGGLVTADRARLRRL
jgi:Transcription factor WhiB